MPAATFRFVCVPSALQGAPAGWARDMLEEGEIALLADSGGLEAVSDVAHALGLPTISLVRAEASPERQEETVIAYAQSMPLVWVAAGLGAAGVAGRYRGSGGTRMRWPTRTEGKSPRRAAA